MKYSRRRTRGKRRRTHTIHLGGERTGRITRRFRVRMGCDLRASLSEKLTAAGGSWEMFVNKKGTLTHILHGPTGVLVRIQARGGGGLGHEPEQAAGAVLPLIFEAVSSLPTVAAIHRWSPGENDA